jgi:hypothetical protein
MPNLFARDSRKVSETNRKLSYLIGLEQMP